MKDKPELEKTSPIEKPPLKHRIYDKIPLTLKQVDFIIAVLVVTLLLVIVYLALK